MEGKDKYFRASGCFAEITVLFWWDKKSSGAQLLSIADWRMAIAKISAFVMGSLRRVESFFKNHAGTAMFSGKARLLFCLSMRA